jgi:hypothetical protein
VDKSCIMLTMQAPQVMQEWDDARNDTRTPQPQTQCTDLHIQVGTEHPEP